MDTTDARAPRPDFAEIYDLHFTRIYNYLFYRVGDRTTADDLVGLVFEKALDALGGFDPRRAPAEAWLFGIARNAITDHFRAQRWRSWLPLDVFAERPGRDPKADAAMLQDESLEQLRRALRALDARQRELLALKFGAGMTNRDIAARMELGESHVGVILHRALKALQAELGAGDE